MAHSLNLFRSELNSLSRLVLNLLSLVTAVIRVGRQYNWQNSYVECSFANVIQLLRTDDDLDFLRTMSFNSTAPNTQCTLYNNVCN